MRRSVITHTCQADAVRSAGAFTLNALALRTAELVRSIRRALA
jgi:hypothetical protein